MSDDDWSALAVVKLSDAGFEPARITELLPVAVSFARARADEGLWARFSTTH
jgi:hypothetical protein